MFARATATIKNFSLDLEICQGCSTAGLRVNEREARRGSQIRRKWPEFTRTNNTGAKNKLWKDSSVQPCTHGRDYMYGRIIVNTLGEVGKQIRRYSTDHSIEVLNVKVHVF
jgi:hypothetical protein